MACFVGKCKYQIWRAKLRAVVAQGSVALMLKMAAVLSMCSINIECL